MDSPALGWLGTYAYDTTEARVEVVRRYLDAGKPVILDSGAFSAFQGGYEIDPAQHAAWVKDWQAESHAGRLLCISLDVIGDDEATYANWQKQKALGADVVPTLHCGVDPSLIDRYLPESSWVALGGMVPYFGTRMRQVIAWCAAVLRRCAKAGTQVHALGAIHPEIHRALPLDSCDSTYWLSGARFGQHALFDPTTRHWRKVSTNTGAAYKFRRLIEDEYGLDPAQVDADTRGVEGRVFAEQLAVASHTLFVETFRARHGSDLVAHLAGGSPDLGQG